MTKYLKFVVVCVFTLSFSARAAYVAQGQRHIAQLQLDAGTGYAYIFVDGGSFTGTTPACATSPTRIAFVATTNTGKAMFSVLNAALLAGKLVEFTLFDNECADSTSRKAAWFVVSR